MCCFDSPPAPQTPRGSYCLHFAEEETELQGGQVTCSGSQWPEVSAHVQSAPDKSNILPLPGNGSSSQFLPKQLRGEVSSAEEPWARTPPLGLSGATPGCCLRPLPDQYCALAFPFLSFWEVFAAEPREQRT